MRNKIYIYFLMFIIPFLICFNAVFVKSNAQALPEYTLDSSSLSVLQGGLNEANNFSMSGQNISGLDPFSIFVVGAFGDMLDRTNTLLGQKYGYDLTDLAFDINDRLESGNYEDVSGDSVAYNLSNGLYQNMASALSNGIRTFTTKVALAGYATKATIMAQLNGNKIQNVLPNAYVKVNNAMINNMGSVASDMIENDELYDFSIANHFLYGKSFNLYFANQDTRCILNFTKPVVICSDINSNSVYLICDTPSKTAIPCSGLVVIGNNTYTVTQCSWTNNGNPQYTITLNGDTYYCSSFFVNNTGSRIVCQSTTKYGNVNDTIITINNNGSFDLPVYYAYSNQQNIYNLLNQLMDKWVTTDDLKQINDAINNLTLGNIVIDNQSLPVIDTSTDSVSDLSTLIQEILDRNADVNSDNTFENQPEPEPEPNPNPYVENQGITVPDGFDTGIIGGLTSTLEMPFKFTSIFQPLFYTFGAFSGMYAIFMFMPIIIIIAFIIWALK